jgi:hypothetical protein
LTRRVTARVDNGGQNPATDDSISDRLSAEPFDLRPGVRRKLFAPQASGA